MSTVHLNSSNDLTHGRRNLTESGSMTNWITYTAGIITGIVLFEIILLLLVVICRKQQIRKEEKEEGHVFIVRKYTRRDSNSSESNPWSSATQNPHLLHHRDKLELQRPEIGTQCHTGVSPAGTPGTVHDVDHSASIAIGNKIESDPKRNEESSQSDTNNQDRDIVTHVGAKEETVDYEGEIIDSDQHNTRRLMPIATLKANITSSNTAGNIMLELHNRDRDIPLGQQLKLSATTNRMCVNNLKPGRSNDDMERAYEELDELQKQIHILSQSIPTLDLYGYEDVDKIKPVPKASRSIPTLLDSAGFEDVDRGYPKKNIMVPKRDLATAKHGSDYPSDKIAPTHVEKSALPLPVGVTVERKTSREPVYSVVQKRKKASSTSDLVSSDTAEIPPPVPPQTAEALYTAATVGQPRNVSTQASAVYANVTDCQGKTPDISQFKTEDESNSSHGTVYGNICKLSNEELYIDL